SHFRRASFPPLKAATSPTVTYGPAVPASERRWRTTPPSPFGSGAALGAESPARPQATQTRPRLIAHHIGLYRVFMSGHVIRATVSANSWSETRTLLVLNS